MFALLGLILAALGVYFVIVGSIILGIVLIVLGLLIAGWGGGYYNRL